VHFLTINQCVCHRVSCVFCVIFDSCLVVSTSAVDCLESGKTSLRNDPLWPMCLGKFVFVSTSDVSLYVHV